MTRQLDLRTRKGIFYFRTFELARQYAIDNGYPSNRIIPYTLGWAIQLKVSGPYVGPYTKQGEAAEKLARMTLNARCIVESR